MLTNACERCGCAGRLAIVVTQQYLNVVSVWPDDRDWLQIFTQRQCVVLVLQKNYWLACGVECELTVFRGIVCWEWDFRVGHHLRWIKHTEPETCFKQSFQGAIDFTLWNQPLLHGIHQWFVTIAAFKIGPSLNGECWSLFGGVHEVMPLVNVVDGAAIRNYVAIKAPLTT